MVLFCYTDKPLVDRVCQAVVVEDYLPTALDELGLMKGQIVEVVKKMSYGWWKGRIANQIGIFPNQNVELVEHQPQQEELERESGHGTYDNLDMYNVHHYIIQEVIIIPAVVRINTYSWGSNSNVTLGHEMSRQYPEKLKLLTHNSIKQVYCPHTVNTVHICSYVVYVEMSTTY